MFGGQDAGRRGKFGACDFSPDCAGGNLDLRVIAKALDFAQLAVGHEVKLVVFFGKPDGGINSNASFAESSDRDVTLATNFWRDGHSGIVNVGPGIRSSLGRGRETVGSLGTMGHTIALLVGDGG